MNKESIIEETANYYNSENRSLNSGGTGCSYLGSNGTWCGFSRCCKNDAKTIESLEAMDDVVGTLNCYELDKNEISYEELLQDQYKGHELEFWRDVQFLHDGKENWNKSGLSEKGQKFKDRLIGKWRE